MCGRRSGGCGSGCTARRCSPAPPWTAWPAGGCSLSASSSKRPVPSSQGAVMASQIRGALNAVRSLVEGSGRAGGELPRAVVTHSSGNHGQALACAAQAEGIPAYIVVPHTAPHCKQAAIRAYGATLVLCEPSDESRAETAARVVRETGGVMVHPNQEPAVIAGQGTIALEVLEQAPEVNAVVVPVGGGGMVAGIAVAIKGTGTELQPRGSSCSPQALRPDVKVFAAEPCNADDCYQSKLRGELTPSLDPRETIADAVRTNIGPNTWPIIRDLVDDVLTVSEEEIKRATRLVWERMKLLIEPTAGVGVAAALSERFQAFPRDLEHVCIVLCGGNVDLSSLTWLTEGPGTAE
ncbi:serine racemase isoform X4 [Strigops habroptila]|uniref:serine racemase isoform X4 n=1 Tax=Strigops habroptila TaxID=2489341 RepID=UPI0011CF29EE|nr:serine racemase isoform X4 [Strigops habroptila]